MMLAERMELLTKRPQGTLFPPAQNRAAWEALPADDQPPAFDRPKGKFGRRDGGGRIEAGGAGLERQKTGRPQWRVVVPCCQTIVHSPVVAGQSHQQRKGAQLFCARCRAGT